MNIICATDINLGIGYKNELPWHIKEDLQYFNKLTTKKGENGEKPIVVMGHNTWLSLPEKHRPLKDRENIVISGLNEIKNVIRYKNFEYFLEDYGKTIELRKTPIWIIGGADLYRTAIIKSYLIKKIYLTLINKKYEVDRYMTEIGPEFYIKNYKIIENCMDSKIQKEVKITFLELEYDMSYLEKTNNFSEKRYLQYLRKIINGGEERLDRTGIGTKSILGSQYRYDLTNKRIPLLTTKKMYWKGIVEELLWFLKGQTNSKILEDKKVNIWKGNSSKEFLESRGLAYEEGDIGPGYGFSFRHWGAEYKDCKTDYTGQGVDQFQNLINNINNDPYSRRHIIDLWNPKELNNMALPPCHILYQFYVSHNGTKLSCSMYQRSGDMGLGVPFNIASASLMTILVAKLTGLEPYELVHTVGDTHIYTNHIEPLKEQILRKPYFFPIIEFNNEKEYKNIEDFEYNDIKLIGYISHPPVKMDMAV